MMIQQNPASGILLVLLLLIALHFTSCKKYLDEKPDSSQAVPKSLSDLQAMLDLSQDMNMGQSPSFGEASSDDYFLLEADYSSFAVEDQKIYTWNRGDYRFQNDWSKAYLPVYYSNYCLEQIQKIPATTANIPQWNNVMGSALFFRAYNFLNLMWVYAKAFDPSTAGTDMGIVLRLSSDFNIASKRASVQDCYNRIITDGKEAIKYLPDNPVHVMRPSKAAAYGLLARTYLSMRQYDSAAKYSNLCLQIKSALMDYNGDPDINGSIAASIPFKKFNKETIFYNEMNTNYFINAPYYAKVDTSLYAGYAAGDLRKVAFYTPSSGYYEFKGSYTETAYQYFTGIATDEMYLIRAESYARTGRISDAMNDLSTLLKMRWDNTVPFVPYTATGSADAINKILLERRKELFMRGVRWMDIKRLNKENANIFLKRSIGGQVYTLAPNDKYYALPLPADIIEQTGIPQN